MEWLESGSRQWLLTQQWTQQQKSGVFCAVRDQIL
jgi:hypothetical protein